MRLKPPETVIVPIAAAILALVMCYELIDIIVEKNNLHDVDIWMIFQVGVQHQPPPSLLSQIHGIS